MVRVRKGKCWFRVNRHYLIKESLICHFPKRYIVFHLTIFGIEIEHEKRISLW